MDEIKHLIKKHKVKDYGMLICIIVLMVFNVLIEINPMSNEGIKKYSWYYQFLTADKKVYEIPTDELSEKLIYDVSTDSLSERYASDNNGDYFICEMRDSEGETKFLSMLALDKMNHLKLVIKDKKKWDISLESMLDLKEMVTMIHEQFPNAIFGTSDELKKKAKTDFDSLISIVENRAEYNY